VRDIDERGIEVDARRFPRGGRDAGAVDRVRASVVVHPG
jgi:hypothetical protein